MQLLSGTFSFASQGDVKPSEALIDKEVEAQTSPPELAFADVLKGKSVNRKAGDVGVPFSMQKADSPSAKSGAEIESAPKIMAAESMLLQANNQTPERLSGENLSDLMDGPKVAKNDLAKEPIRSNYVLSERSAPKGGAETYDEMTKQPSAHRIQTQPAEELVQHLTGNDTPIRPLRTNEPTKPVIKYEPKSTPAVTPSHTENRASDKPSEFKTTAPQSGMSTNLVTNSALPMTAPIQQKALDLDVQTDGHHVVSTTVKSLPAIQQYRAASGNTEALGKGASFGSSSISQELEKQAVPTPKMSSLSKIEKAQIPTHTLPDDAHPNQVYSDKNSLVETIKQASPATLSTPLTWPSTTVLKPKPEAVVGVETVKNKQLLLKEGQNSDADTVQAPSVKRLELKNMNRDGHLGEFATYDAATKANLSHLQTRSIPPLVDVSKVEVTVKEPLELQHPKQQSDDPYSGPKIDGFKANTKAAPNHPSVLAAYLNVQTTMMKPAEKAEQMVEVPSIADEISVTLNRDFDPRVQVAATTVVGTKSGVHDAVIRQLTDALRNGANQTGIQIELDPIELGRVRLSLNATDGAMSMLVMAERGETAELLRRNIDQLAIELKELGYENLQFEFQEQADWQNSKDSDAQPQQIDRDSSSHHIEMDAPQMTVMPSAIIADDRLDIRL